jgi:hypothetical protein
MVSADFGIPVSREIFVADEAGRFESPRDRLPISPEAASEKSSTKQAGSRRPEPEVGREIREARRLLAIGGCSPVQEMVRVSGTRLRPHQDARFGPCVMFGLGDLHG